MRRLGKIFARAICMVLAVPALYALYILLTPVSLGKLPPLRDGDLVFQTIRTGQSLAINFATLSPYTHVGIVKMEGTSPVVVEAVGPVREIPLDAWIKQGVGDRFAVARMKGLSKQQAASALAAARGYFGRPYDFYFLSGDDEIYCSELVYKAFRDGPDIALGKEQKVGDLFVRNFAVRALIEQRWQTYPPCNGVKDFNACYDRVMAQPLVSPASVYADSKLERIYSNYGVFR